MFKTRELIVILSLCALTLGRPQSAPAVAAAAGSTSSSSNNALAPHTESGNVTFVKDDRTPLDDKGTYKYDIELTDGTKFNQEGNTEAPGSGENETSIVIKGSYSYVAPDGTPVNVMYIANKDGFQPTGDVIPSSSGNKKSSSGAIAPNAPAPISSGTATVTSSAPVPAPSAAAAGSALPQDPTSTPLVAAPSSGI